MSAKEDTESSKKIAGVKQPKIPIELSSDEESESESESSKNGRTSKSNYPEVLDKVKASSRLIHSRVLKKDSEEAAEAVDNLYATIVGLTAKLTFVEGKLL